MLQDEERCTGCSKCDAMCPIGAITMEKKQRSSSLHRVDTGSNQLYERSLILQS